MEPAQSVVIDDRLLIEQLVDGFDDIMDGVELYTTSYWYYRASRAAVAGAAGHLSGPFQNLDQDEQERAILTLLNLPDAIGLPDPRATVPAMARAALRHSRLNVLNLEAVAAAGTLDATVWLSPRAAEGVLPAALEADGIPWATVPL